MRRNIFEFLSDERIDQWLEGDDHVTQEVVALLESIYVIRSVTCQTWCKKMLI